MVNFIHELNPDSDLHLFFGGETAFKFTDQTRLEDILVQAGKFKSKTECRKLGFQGSIPPGLNCLVIGKAANRMEIWTLNYVQMDDK